MKRVGFDSIPIRKGDLHLETPGVPSSSSLLELSTLGDGVGLLVLVGAHSEAVQGATGDVRGRGQFN